MKNERTIRTTYPFNVVVIELGTDGPGFMKEFAYIKPEIAVLTSVAHEHMEYFKTMDAVAKEELVVFDYAKKVLINADDIDDKYLAKRKYAAYSSSKKCDYQITSRRKLHLKGQTLGFKLANEAEFKLTVPLLGEQGAKVVLGAAATAHLLKIPVVEIQKGLSAVEAFAGRMQILPGILNSTILDDTYNSSPLATIAALDVLQSGDAPQRIAILGSMNELGEHSEAAHRDVGEHCDPSKLAWVITIGRSAKEFLAPVAKKRGCQVKSFMSPYDAGKFVKKEIKEGAVVLAKGSQNGVFAEESLKQILQNPDDESKLVRQSPHWMEVKRQQFKV